LYFNSSGKPTRTLARGITFNNTSVGLTSVKLNNANVFEIVRGAGWTGSTGAFSCIESSSGITCTFNPTIKEFDGLMYGSRSHVYVTNFKGLTANIVLSSIPNDGRVYGFDLILSNALNPSNSNTRFSSNVYWAFNRPPCFSYNNLGTGITCDIKLSFFGLGGATMWYGSAFSTSSKCPDNKIFDSNCSSDPFMPSGSSTYRQLGDIGACCTSNGGCTETYAEMCGGFFHGIGTTCGSGQNLICNKVGACCVFNEEYSCYDYLTCTDCLALGDSSYIKTQFAGKYTTCSDIDCSILNQIYFNIDK